MKYAYKIFKYTLYSYVSCHFKILAEILAIDSSGKALIEIKIANAFHYIILERIMFAKDDLFPINDY